MRFKALRRGGRRLVMVAATCYAIFLLCAPFEHHDLSCELKTPQHCTACTSSVLSSNPDVLPSSPGVSHLSDAGSAVPLDVRAESILLGVRTTGRSPPPFA
jgi:hypothetical protein